VHLSIITSHVIKSESPFSCLPPLNRWSYNTFQTLINNQINKECKKLKCKRYLVIKGKLLKNSSKDKKKNLGQPNPW
jgi:hypothetical protein